ncbi:HEPN domain-containing protein [Brevibacterium litoralis]|uniref:HEPN domain-containing protein n=1 Tax=Brevibacterium litoralis TaxID=3138935 RepID=UPI0032EB88F0
MAESIARMLDTRRLERVAVNVDHAKTVIDTAKKHIATARVLAGTDDPGMAFTAAYDGARKALTSVLAVEGLRVRPVGGAHRNTGIAARLFVENDSLDEFEWMRQVRNATEYPDEGRPTATRQDVDEAIEASEAIVRVCAEYVQTR